MSADTFDVQLFDGHIDTWRLVVATLLCWVITSLSVSAGGVMLPNSRHRGSMVEGAPQPQPMQSSQCVWLLPEPLACVL